MTERARSIVWLILRWLFGGYYLVIGILFALTLLHLFPPQKLQVSAQSAAFQHALAATGFMMPLLLATYIVGGAALFRLRTAPLGLAILGPAVVIITLTDTLLDTAYPVAAINIVVFLALAWHFRAAYRPMWNFGP